MISVDSSKYQDRLDRTVRVLCPLIDEQIEKSRSNRLGEKELRLELVSCLLGSQVSHQSATAAMENLVFSGLMKNGWWEHHVEPNYEELVYGVLNGVTTDLPNQSRYRFPRTKARQLAAVRDQLAKEPLVYRLGQQLEARILRDQLINSLPGIGPKQASMFLRNIGLTYELAVIDTHVIRFMELLGFPLEFKSPGRSICAYERAERSAIEYAEAVGYPVGLLDLAIWITMKAAREVLL